MRPLYAIGGLLLLLVGSGSAMAQDVPNLKGTWLPEKGAQLIDGHSLHYRDGTAHVAGGDKELHRDTSRFIFHFDAQDGRTFWGSLSSGKVSESLIGAISGDGKRFVIADKDGTFNGTVVDTDTLDYCYAHVTPTSRAVACGLLVRQK
ncbi:hypothetical protein NLM33_07410 [Bradyrhizobium sp. CCGUVB1N3]|uniref:hypothetical protein n=1 Tax=Bradyrhizobium sp. CCGUVB1N3 TaxID=2949629 RepID=UPI0020B2355D|nr:hypothetical protein [Bradyrhizobium sp. CCGUVB1N3]MCP3470152.1 hypothetical protein [Bradyrhizobium sp. CCGUVB1N3]